MAKTELVFLPVPRAAKVVYARCVQPETIAVVDMLPFHLPSLSADEAPVAIRMSETRRGRDEEHWRAFEGALYRPFAELPGATPERACALMRTEMDKAANEKVSHRYWSGSEQPYTLGALFQEIDIEKKRGARPEGEHRLRQMIDDGKEGQRQQAELAQRNFILVDGMVYHRAPAPYLRISVEVKANPLVRLEWEAPFLTDHGWTERRHSDAPWFDFPVDREEDARAMAEVLRDEYGASEVVSYKEARFEVVDGDAFRSTQAHEPLGTFVRRSGESFLRKAGKVVGFCPDAAIARYCAARRVVAALHPDTAPAEAAQAFEEIRSCLEDFTGAEPDEGIWSDWEKVTDAARRVLWRHDNLEVAAARLDDDVVLGGVGL